MGDARWREVLAAHDAAIRRELDRFGGREVKTIGDAFLATFEGAPSPAVRCAREIVGAVAALGLELRVGLHTGECEVIGDDVGGMAVHIAARVAGAAQPGQVLASGTTYGTVVGSGLRWDDHGARRAGGRAGAVADLRRCADRTTSCRPQPWPRPACWGSRSTGTEQTPRRRLSGEAGATPRRSPQDAFPHP